MDSEIEWLIGFFEGEGTIGVSGWNDTSAGVVTIGVSNNERTLLEPFQRRFSGHIYATEGGEGKRLNYKTNYFWKVSAAKIVAPLLEMLPYFKSERNKRRAMLALELQSLKNEWHRGGRATLELGIQHRAKLRPLYEELQALNHRGSHS